MEYYYGKLILIKNYQVFKNVLFVMILLIIMENYLKKHVKLVKRNSIQIVLWNGLVKVIKVNVLCVSHSFCENIYKYIYIKIYK